MVESCYIGQTASPGSPSSNGQGMSPRDDSEENSFPPAESSLQILEFWQHKKWEINNERDYEMRPKNADNNSQLNKLTENPAPAQSIMSFTIDNILASTNSRASTNSGSRPQHDTAMTYNSHSLTIRYPPPYHNMTQLSSANILARTCKPGLCIDGYMTAMASSNASVFLHCYPSLRFSPVGDSYRHEYLEAFESEPAIKKKRRHRTIFTEEQLDQLEAIFERTHHPDILLREQLSFQYKLKEERIEIWFKNRRAKWRKQRREEQNQIRSVRVLMQCNSVSRRWAASDVAKSS